MRLTLFGSVQVSWEEGNPPRFRSQRTAALLDYLVAEARPLSRAQLGALFWPDEDPCAIYWKHAKGILIQSIRHRLSVRFSLPGRCGSDNFLVKDLLF